MNSGRVCRNLPACAASSTSGAYLPYRRLDRSQITAFAGSGGGKGTRTVSSYDEDTTTMGVEAARLALRGAPGVSPDVRRVRHLRARVRGPDQRHRDPGRAAPRHRPRSPSTTARRCARLRRRCSWRCGAPARRSSSPPTSAPVCPAAATRPQAVTAPPRCSSATATPGTPAVAEFLGRRRARAASSSTGGAHRATCARSSGRSASARSSTCRSASGRGTPRASRPRCRPNRSTA